MIVLVVAAVAFGAVGILALRRPLLARMAAREAVRRRGQSVLVVMGLMIGSAAITASLVGADSNQQSFVLDAYRSWGNVDLTVGASSAFLPSSLADRLAADPAVRRVTDGVAGVIQAVGSVSDLTRRQGEPAVTVVGFDPRRQAPFGRFVLLSGRTTLGGDLGPGGVLLSRGLAERLSARVGDVLSIRAEQPGAAPAEAGPRAPLLRVAGIVRSEGPGAYGLGPAVFAPLDLARAVVGRDGINLVWVSARGGLIDGLTRGEAAAPVLRRAVASLSFPLPLTVRQVKRDTVRAAEGNTKFLRVMLVALSMLILAAGAALVVNLVLMLAEERRPRLGVLRALGMRRRSLVEMQLIEGALYSLGAAAVGTAVGIPAGRVVAERFASAFDQFFGGELDFRFSFSLRPWTLAVAFASGALATLVTVALAARRTSRLSIPSAIRDLPEPAPDRPRRARRALVPLGAVAGVGLLVASVPSSDDVLRLLGGALLIVAGAAGIRPRLAPRAHSSALGVALAGWAFFITATIVDPDRNAEQFFTVFTLSVLLAVFGLSILAAANLFLAERAAALLGRAAGAVRRNLRAPLAYLARRPVRTGLTTGMFGVVVSILALFSVLLFAFRPQYERDSAGFDIRVTSTGTASLTLPPQVAGSVRRAVELPTFGYVGPVQTGQFASVNQFVPLYRLDPTLGAAQPVHLVQREERFPDDRAVWRAVLANPRYVVSDFVGPGQRITLATPKGRRTFEVVASETAGILDGVLASPSALAPFGHLARGSTVLVDVRPGADPQAVAKRIEALLFYQGVDARTTRGLLDDSYRATTTFFSVVDVLMRMGLVVGILSLGILGLRAVVERRHVIGVLRALGFRRRAVMAGLMAEAGVTASLGVVVGVATGLLMGFLFLREQAGGVFGVDGANLAGVLALVYVAVAVVTAGPAWRASRLPPAEALRYTE